MIPFEIPPLTICVIFVTALFWGYVLYTIIKRAVGFAEAAIMDCIEMIECEL
jgi:hypothetical protein